MAELGFLAKLVVNSRLTWLFHRFFGVSRLLDLVKLEPERIIEVGCGVGITTSFIAAKFKKAEVAALDLESQISAANKLKVKDERVKFVAGDATSLNFDSCSFDAAFEIFTFHHIPDYEAAIAEICRVLKKGGKFYIMDAAIKSFPLHRLVFFEPVHFTKDDFVRILQKRGFRINQSFGRVFFKIEAEKV